MALILCSIDALPRMGGVSVMAHELANAFADAGETVVFVGPAGAHAPLGFERRYHLYDDAELRRNRGDQTEAEDRRIETLFSRLIANAPGGEPVRRIALVHPHRYGVGAQRAADAAGVPLSVWFHGFELRSQLRGRYPQDAAAQMTDPPRALRERTFHTIGRAQELLANSRYTAGLLAPFPVRPDIAVTGCGIPERLLPAPGADFAAARAEARAALGLPDDACVLAYVGRLEPTKRVDRVAAIAAARPGLHALLIGAGDLGPAIAAQAEAAGASDRVRLLGPVPEAEKWRALRAADFACLMSEPSEATGNVEGFGIALLEGAAAGAVPVTSGEGGMADVVAHDATGLVLPPALTAAEAADALAAARADPARMDRLRAGAQAQLHARYNWRTIAERLLASWRTEGDAA